MNDFIEIIGAKEHNLKNINLKIPKNKLVVFTGISGSGKSTLAFDTLYAEGQRRYIESLSSYARQFLDRMKKPNVDKINGLTPAVAIDQKSTSKNPRSTVGTITEIYDYLRLLYARVGVQHCHKCGKKVSSMSANDITNEILKFPKGAKLTIISPVVREKKGSFEEKLESLKNKGFVRAFVDGVLVRLDESALELSKTKKHTIKAVIDRVVLSEEDGARVANSVEKALFESFGEVEVEVQNAEELGIKQTHHFSEHNACFECKISYLPLEPLSFSFNSPKGACESCDGLGVRFVLDLDKVINPNLSVSTGAVKIFYGFNKSYHAKFLEAFCEQNGVPTKVKFGELNEDEKRLILYGNVKPVSFLWKKHRLERTFEGVINTAYEMLKNESDFEDYMTEKACPECKANRLKKESLAVKFGGAGLGEVINLSIQKAFEFFSQEFKFSGADVAVAGPILFEIRERLKFLNDVGLGYLTLGRDARTISGGEAQRIRIASQIGSGLSGVLYVLDEPSIGLHERDTLKLINTLRSLQEKGNSVIVVEHDKKTIEAADFVVDIGVGAGKNGGEVIFSGTVEEMKKSGTLTASYINGEKKMEYFAGRKSKQWLKLSNVNINNISNLSVKIPLGNLVGVTGVSGSGKSSLVLQTLLPTALGELNRVRKVRTSDALIEGLEALDKAIYLDQSPIGRTPRSNPATYTGVMDELRVLFAQTKEAKIRGYGVGRFSFNVKGGRCERCGGDGLIKVEMHFLPDVSVVCDACGGARYNAQTLEVKFKGRSIADVLNMSVEEALEFFEAFPKVAVKLKTLYDVGLGYVALGQAATTLSGGEAQRIKLAKELSRAETGRTLYVLDEPTTGLHFADVDRLVRVLQRLVELGNSVVVIEHNLDVIKNCDYILDLGPEGGSKGGKVVASGSPFELARGWKKSGSFTGQFLAEEILGEEILGEE